MARENTSTMCTKTPMVTIAAVNVQWILDIGYISWAKYLKFIPKCLLKSMCQIILSNPKIGIIPIWNIRT
jgi:hypothetical protein